jgi:hypothetical protein
MVRKKLSRVSRNPARKTSRVRRTWVVRRSDEGEAQSRSGAGQMGFLRSRQISLTFIWCCLK